MNATPETITFLGWTDEVTACDLCGKSDLKSTAALEIDGAIVYFGCVCAAKALAPRFTDAKLTAAKIKRLTEKAHDEQIACGAAFERGLYWGEYLASCETIKAARKLDPKACDQIGLNGKGGFHASRKIGPNKWERFESLDLNAVIAWVRSNLE